NRTTDWSEWLFVETDDIRLGSSDVSVELEATRGALKEVLKDVTRVYDRMDEIMEQVAAAAAVGTGMNVVDRQVYTEQVRNAFAQIIEEKKLRADADSAIAEVTTLLQSKMDDPETGNQALASAVQNTRTEVTRQGGELAAMSESLTGVKAEVNDISADGYLSIKANTNPGGGALSEVSISARGQKGGQTALGAHTVRVVERNGQLYAENIFFADRTIFASANGGVIGIPIVFENGQMVLDVGRIRKAIIDEFVTGNGKLQILGYGDN